MAADVTQKFFITGLPRSGTAWLANFLSYGRDVFCYHEASAFDLDKPADNRQQRALSLMDLTGAREGISRVGNACSDVLNWPTDLPGEVVIIRREAQDSLASLKRAWRGWGQDPSVLDEVYDRNLCVYEKFLEKFESRALMVDFSELWTLKAAARIWEHCVGTDFPQLHFAQKVVQRITLRDWRYPVQFRKGGA